MAEAALIFAAAIVEGWNAASVPWGQSVQAIGKSPPRCDHSLVKKQATGLLTNQVTAQGFSQGLELNSRPALNI